MMDVRSVVLSDSDEWPELLDASTRLILSSQEMVAESLMSLARFSVAHVPGKNQ